MDMNLGKKTQTIKDYWKANAAYHFMYHLLQQHGKY